MSILPFHTAADLHRVLDTPSLVEALRTGFREGAHVPVRHSHVIEDDAGGEWGRLLLMPAWRPGIATGVKIVTVYPGNRARGASTVAALYALLDGETGHPRALLEGEALTLLRTGAVSALAATLLARSDARTLVVVGTGQLAPYMARAHCAVRGIDRVLVWGRSAERAAATAQRLRADGVPAAPVADLDAALAEADVVTCATTSTAPLVHGAAVRPGTHVDLVGGFTPQMREADDELIASARLFVDTRAGTLKEAGDLVQPIAAGRLVPDGVLAELADLVGGRHAGRASDAEITVFKSVGTGLADLAAARLAAERLA